jgi:hypothetical protein
VRFLSLLQLLAEYADSHDAAEASRCLRGLAVPFFHHELVKQGLHVAMESTGQMEHILALLKRCVAGATGGLQADCFTAERCCPYLA